MLATLLLGFSPGGRCLGEPPAEAASAEASAFDAIAKNIENTVLRLGYPKNTADDLVRLVRGWKLEAWKQKLAQAGSASSPRNTAEIARVEEEATRALYAKMGAEIHFCSEERYFHLAAVLKDKKAQCLGYSQLLYILGNSVGLSVSVTDILELSAGPLPAREGHVACVVGRSDSTSMLVDLAQRFISSPFVFQNEYLAAGNYWELRRKDNPLGIHRRIQVWNETGLVACIDNSLGHSYAKAGQYAQAISYVNQAIELNPKYAEAFSNRGKLYGELRQHAQAISDFTKAIELNPRNAQAFYNRGNRYRELMRHAQAISDYDKAIELDPTLAWAFNNRGNTCLGLKQYAQAISDYDKAIALNPNDAEAFYNRGVAHARMGQHAQAVSDYNKAIEMNPRLAAAYAGRGITYAVQRKEGEARADLKKALDLNPALRELVRSTSDYFHLGL